MALVKCKECGEQVSTKAKNCPKCGARVPKKTSLFTWLVLIFIILIVYVANQAPTTTSSNSIANSVSSSSTEKKKTESVKKTPPPKPSWSTSTSKDEMTKELSAYAHSPVAFPNKVMSFPYSDVNAWLGVGCDKGNEWVYIGFSSAPNLANTETEDGYNLIKTRVKWNNEIENVVLSQDWGAKFLHFRNDASALAKIASSNTALLELQWHGQQPIYFEFTLNGSSKAISEIKAKCGR